MNSFQRKSLYAALAGAGALGVTGAAEAVSVNPNGVGSVLIYPYYTVQSDNAGNAYNSLLSIVNSSASAKAVKVRFLEGKRSVEVLDFNLFLSKNDVWTAGIVPNAAGGASMLTVDKSCTIPFNFAAPPGFPFKNVAYTGDGGGDGLDRTKEGYVEIIEMATFATFTSTYRAINHPGGATPDCGQNNFILDDNQAATDAFGAPNGGLFGGMHLINVGAGTDYTEDAVALQRFSDVPIYQPAGTVSPQLTDSSPKVSVVFGAEPNPAAFCCTCVSSDLGVYISKWPTPDYLAADTVSAALMHDSVMNEYVLEPGVLGQTDWVLTFPTKRFYSFPGTGAAVKLFQRNFNGGLACDDITLNIYDREEKTTSQQVTVSPPSPGQTTSISYEANVITFFRASVGPPPASANYSNVLLSRNFKGISDQGFTNGWLRLGFVRSTSATFHTLGNVTNTTHVFSPTFISTGLTKTYLGLPVIGFAVQSFSNGTLVVGGVTIAQNYGGNFVQKATTTIIN